MPSIPIRQRIRSVLGSVVRKRLLRSRDRFVRKAKEDCKGTQQATLQRILTLNHDSEFSITHGLNGHLSVDQFRERLPVCEYAMFREAIDRMAEGNHQALLGGRNKLLMYALTSGTTDRIKKIPITRQFVTDYRRGWQHWGISIHEKHPEMKLLKMVQLNSHHAINRTTDGIPCGNISGLVTSMQSPIIRKLYSIPAAVTLIEDPNQRRLAAARFAVADAWAGMFVTANPSSLINLLVTADKHAEEIIRQIADGTIDQCGLSQSDDQQLMKKIRPDVFRAKFVERVFEECGTFAASQIWPKACVLGVWTGGSVAAFLPELRRRFGDLPIRDHGLHASEGRMTIPLADDSASGVLDIDSHFFEFIPEGEANSSAPDILQAHELTVGSNYEILLTTVSGLYRYNIHDVVQCTGFFGSTPMLQFLHKGAHISSITGEKITESQVVQAVRESLNVVAERATACSLFTMTPVWGSPPGYQLFVSDQLTKEQLPRLALEVERRLSELNCEYQDKRHSNRLKAVECLPVSDAEWTQLTEARLRISGGSLEQYKHPFLLPDPEFQRHLLTLLGHPVPSSDS